MPISKIKSGSLDTGSITTDKIATDAITEAKIADTAIENEHLNTNVISGQSELAETAEATDAILIYDTSTGTLKKINVINVNLGNPTISSITPTNVDSKDSSTTTTFTVTGTNFYTGTTAKLISNSATDISFTTVTRDSNTQLSCVLNNGLITLNTDEPYDIFVNNGIGTTTLSNQINVDQRPVWVTASGSLGNVTEGNAASFTVEATDPESAGAIRYDVVGNSLPDGLSLNTATGAITGTAGAVGADTTSTFTIQASDVDSNVSFREFSITIVNITITSFTSSGTLSVPVGVTAVDVLVVAGGGGGGYAPSGDGTGAFYSGAGGAGGLIYRPAFPVTPGGTVTVTVGCGGTYGTSCGTAAPGGQDSVFGTLTAKGGGGGGGRTSNGTPGGSGGGGGAPGTRPGGSATQPTQPGDSGTYGFGNAGGTGTCSPSPVATQGTGGGGGGAGSAGGNGGSGKPGPYSTGAPHYAWGGPGGAGRAYTIADGTTPVYYAGGGSGGGHSGATCGDGLAAGANAKGTNGTANRGQGAGAGLATGSKGIVIVKF
jgi:hypothetical protein